MDKLNLSSLKDKIASKLGNGGKDSKGSKKGGKKGKKVGGEPSKTDEHTKKGSDEVVDDDELRREALSLGATEEDLKLLRGVESGDESEQEFGGDSVTDNGLSTELTNFMKGIGLEGKLEVIDDDEVEPELVGEEEEEEEEDDQSGEEEHDQSEEEEEEKEQKETQKEDSSDSDSDSDSDQEEEEEEESDSEVQIKEAEKQKDTDKITDFSIVDSSKLAIPSRLDWYNTPLEPVTNPDRLDKFGIDRLYERAKKVVEDDNQLYLKEFTSNNSQRKFLSQILSDGTLNDKISALTLMVQESPIHNLKAFDTLLGFCEKKSRTAALQAINAFKDLIVNGLVPDRRLIAFNKRPMTTTISDVHLAVYYFEDHLKKAYFKLVQILEHLIHDPIVHVKMNVVGHIFDLIKAKPEQEANLLRLGVNKLGDIENKVAGKASYQILQLEQVHPAMKKIVTESIIDIIFKPNIEHNAQYYSILTLNQTILTRNDPDLANELVKTYFSLFSKVLIESDPHNVDKKEDKTLGKSERGRKNNRKNFKKGKKGGKSVKKEEKSEREVIEEKNSKLFSGLLTGLNRAFPFSTLPNEVYEQHLDTLFKITHSSNFNTSVQALVLVYHIISKQKLNPDRFYRTLYESLLDPRLLNSSKQGIYLNLLFKALSNDKENVDRVLAFVKRILQICSHWLNIGTISGMLYLLSELAKIYPQIADLMIDINSRPDIDELNKDVVAGEYDSRKRDPKFANASKSSLWELSQFLNHYHPTISIYAESFLEGKPQTKPDLGLYSLSHFLDRFVYKNAKAKASTKGTSIMQPLGGSHTGSLLVKATNVMDEDVPVNTGEWLAKKSKDVRPDESFFHQYFTTKESKVRDKRDRTKKGEDEELDDEEVWSALVKSRPEIEDDSDEGSVGFDEEDFSDFDEEGEEEEEGEELEGGETNEFDDFDGELPFEAPDISDDEENLDFIDQEDEISSEEDDPKKRSRDDKDKKDKKSKKQKLKQLPVFASVDDYSQYLNSDDEDYS